ncbi:MAG TPA: hypothetical protein GXZ48_05690 [Acholeplasmataceae bacterium]|nr:hypothetical protein [Acholeplasmataceae bacterium]
MKFNYHFNKFDTTKNYYFFDGEKYFEVSKDIPFEEYENLNNKYYQKSNNLLFKYLFDGEPFPYDKNFYKFVVIDFLTNELNSKKNLLSFFNDLLGKVDILELKGKTVCFYYDILEYDLKNILVAASDDFGMNFKTYISGKLYTDKPKGFQTIFECYLQYGTNNSRLHTNNGDLILDLAKKDISKLDTIKPYILNKIYNDSQYEKLINSMFENNLNVTKTAKDVYMHRNTINNKIEFIKEETSLNMQSFKDAVAMYLLITS